MSTRHIVATVVTLTVSGFGVLADCQGPRDPGPNVDLRPKGQTCDFWCSIDNWAQRKQANRDPHPQPGGTQAAQTKTYEDPNKLANDRLKKALQDFCKDAPESKDCQ